MGIRFKIKYGNDKVKMDAAKEYISNIPHLMTYSERNIFSDPKFPPEAHHLILDRFKENIRFNMIDSILDHPNISPDVLHRIAKDFQPIYGSDVTRYIATHKNVSQETLRMMHTNSEDHNTDRYVASNSKTPDDVLSTLSHHPDHMTRFEVAINPSTKIEDLRYIMTNDKNIENRWKAEDTIRRRTKV